MQAENSPNVVPEPQESEFILLTGITPQVRGKVQACKALLLLLLLNINA